MSGRWIKMFCVVAALALGPIACQSALQPVELIEMPTAQKWYLLGARDADALAGRDGSPPQAYFELQQQGRLAGHGGCNAIFGTYVLNESMLSFPQVGRTKKACIGAMAAEEALLRVLQGSHSWSLEAGVLVLHDEAGALLGRFLSARP